MDLQPHRRPVGLTDALALLAISAIGVLLGAALRPDPTVANATAVVDTQTQPGATAPTAAMPAEMPSAAGAARSDTKNSPPPATPHAKSSTLPPAELPISQTYAELAAQARAGDGGAALRLAEELQDCTIAPRNAAKMDKDPQPDLSVEDLAWIESAQQRVIARLKRCEGITREQQHEAYDWLRQAALAGNAEAMLCNAVSESYWRNIDDVLSPEWRRDAQHWREEAPGMVERALYAGVPEAAAVLASMYGPLPDIPTDQWHALSGDHPDLAYLYARIYRDHAAPNLQQEAQEALDLRAARLSASARAVLDARAQALEARITFTTPIAYQTGKPPAKACERFVIMAVLAE